MKFPHVSDETRKWVYNVGIAVLPLLVGYLGAERLPLWQALLAALLVGSPSAVARANWVRTDDVAVVANRVVASTMIVPVPAVAPEAEAVEHEFDSVPIDGVEMFGSDSTGEMPAVVITEVRPDLPPNA